MLVDPDATASTRTRFLEVYDLLRALPELSFKQRAELIYGPERLTYGAGCDLYRQIEGRVGFPAVQAALQMESTALLEQYIHLFRSPLS